MSLLCVEDVARAQSCVLPKTAIQKVSRLLIKNYQELALTRPDIIALSSKLLSYAHIFIFFKSKLIQSLVSNFSHVVLFFNVYRLSYFMFSL